MIMYLFFKKMLSLTIFYEKKILFSFSMVAVSNVLLMNKRL